MATLDSRVLMSLTLFKLSLIARHLGCLQCLNTINNTAGPPGFLPLAWTWLRGWGSGTGTGTASYLHSWKGYSSHCLPGLGGNRGPGLLLCHRQDRVSGCHLETSYLACGAPGMGKGTRLAEASGLLNQQGSHFELFASELAF